MKVREGIYHHFLYVTQLNLLKKKGGGGGCPSFPTRVTCWFIYCSCLPGNEASRRFFTSEMQTRKESWPTWQTVQSTGGRKKNVKVLC